MRRGIRGWLLEIFWFLELLVYCLTFRCLERGLENWVMTQPTYKIPRKFSVSLPLSPRLVDDDTKRHQNNSISYGQLIGKSDVWGYFGIKAEMDRGSAVKFADTRWYEERLNRLTILSNRWTCILQSLIASCSEILLHLYDIIRDHRSNFAKSSQLELDVYKASPPSNPSNSSSRYY